MSETPAPSGGFTRRHCAATSDPVQYGPLTILTVKSASNRLDTTRVVTCEGCTYLRSKWDSHHAEPFRYRCVAEGGPSDERGMHQLKAPPTCPYLSGTLTGPVEMVGWTP